MPLQVDLIFQGYTIGHRHHQAHHDNHQDHVHQYTQPTQHSYTGKEQNIPPQIIRAHLVITGIIFMKIYSSQVAQSSKYCSAL